MDSRQLVVFRVNPQNRKQSQTLKALCTPRDTVSNYATRNTVLAHYGIKKAL